uniref:Uncharacterized protein n=1 Tax=Homo sapiens TaxID=9606 RepID=A0ABJ7HAP4_HUMAN
MDTVLVLLLGLQALAGPSPKPQKDSVSDWAIVLITLTLVAAIVSLMYGIKKACQFRREMSLGCGCGSVTPYSSHHEGEAASQRYSCQMKGGAGAAERLPFGLPSSSPR